MLETKKVVVTAPGVMWRRVQCSEDVDDDESDPSERDPDDRDDDDEASDSAVMSPGSSDHIGFSSLVTIELRVSDNVTMCGVPARI